MNSQYKHPLKPLISNAGFLSELADGFGTPLYVYDGHRLTENAKRFNNAVSKSFSNFTICYALKANSNPHIISHLKSSIAGLGADCSSPGELYIADRVGIPSELSIYTGNYESEGELKIVLDSGVHINLDDISSYKRLKGIQLPNEISFRLNPGFGKGTFPAIVTGGKEAKFGIPIETIINAYYQARTDGVEQFGLQCMPGSGNLESEYFVELLKIILNTANEIENKLDFQFNYISIGGGLGIPYKVGDVPLDIDHLFEQLGKMFYSYYSEKDAPKLLIEPGKYLVADAGFLLSRVTSIKESYKKFIGLDAGMNTLLRPTLYNTYHHIFMVGDPDAVLTQTVDFTGQICENTDRLAKDRQFPDISEGDLVAIMDTGAYGFTMANQYNTRPRPAEVLLSDGETKLIRQRENIHDIFKLCNWN